MEIVVYMITSFSIQENRLFNSKKMNLIHEALSKIYQKRS
ncbi:MAG: hypothetical protein YK1312THETA_2350004 [Marine Group I thaumarchaeote]|nr:MAG: hypothetical protein YK1312THETA_2350004 [Marine Group I thaumarchaeote]